MIRFRFRFLGMTHVPVLVPVTVHAVMPCRASGVDVMICDVVQLYVICCWCMMCWRLMCVVYGLACFVMCLELLRNMLLYGHCRDVAFSVRI